MHGLGFAGALKEIGLPQNHLSVALLTFNIGVELGQLFVVGIAYLIYRAFSSLPKLTIARTSRSMSSAVSLLIGRLDVLSASLLRNC